MKRDSGWYTERADLPSFSYIKLAKGTVAKTLEFGPKQLGWVQSDGTPDPEAHVVAEVLLDVAEDGTILGIELLVPGRATWDVRREEETSE